MKKGALLTLLILNLSGCMPTKSELSVNLKKKNESAVSSASVSSVQIINHQLIIHGAYLNKVTSVKVNGNSLNENFAIESQTATKIIANAVQGFSFDVSKVFSLILSDASASATFQIDFSLCNATLNGAGFDCSAAIADNDVLSYDLASNTWIPRSLNGLSYKGVWDANTAAPTSNQAGQYYIVSVANLPTYKVGDWIVWNGSSYDVVAQSGGGGAISTVFGRIGTVVATEGDYNLDKLLDVDLSTAPTTGQVLKYDGAKWIADNETGGAGGPGSVTTTELADGSVTNVKIADVAASKITGTITSAQITDGTIVNADISATAAIAYSKLSIPALSIPYAQLNIADGDIPAAKIAGLPSATAVLTTAITDGDTTHAPDGNVVFDTLATKLDKTGGTISTMLNVPTPVLDTEATTKLYVDTADNLKANKAGDTFSGVLTLDNDLKIKGGSNYVTVKGNAASAAYTLTLPVDAGTNNQVLTTNGSGVLSWTTPAGSSISLTGDVGGTAGANTIGSGKVTSTHILDGTIVNADINAAAAIDYSKLNVPAAAIPLTALNATGTKDATKYLKGDNTWATLTTDVLATTLSGLSLTNATITASDTVISAFGKLQKQVTDSAVATMSGDLSGTLPSPTVAKIKGVAVSATAPTDGQFFKYTSSGTNWVPSFVTVTDLKSTALGNLFPGSGCTANQTLYYSVVGDSFSCANIDLLDGAKITTGTIAAARLPASASYWAAATGGINYAGGNVGIGSSAPAGKLSVEGTGAVGMQIKSTGAAAIDTMNLINDMDAAGNFWFAKGASASAAPAAADKLINITNQGNVEIYGQQANATKDFSGILSLKTQASSTGGTKNEVSMEFYADRTDLNAKSGYFGYESGTVFDMTLMNAKNANLILGTNNAEKMRITSAGYVGIGNNNPTKALSVNGEIEALTVTANTVSGAVVNAGSLAVTSGSPGWVIGGLKNTAADGYSGFSMLDNNNNIKGFMGFSNASAGVLPGSLFYTSSGVGIPVILGTNQTERIRVTDTGVGVNGSNGAYMFYVNGTAGGTSAYVNTSDRRLKKDIVTIPNALERVGQLRGVNYNWNHDVHPELNLGHREEMGVIAQEVEKVFPDAVSEDKTNGIKSVAYSMLIAPLIEAVKTLHKMVVDIFSVSQKHSREIASVKSDLANKDQEIKKLQRENAEMKARLDRMEKMFSKK